MTPLIRARVEIPLLHLAVVLFAIMSASDLCKSQWSAEAEVPWQTRIDDPALDHLLEHVELSSKQRCQARSIYEQHRKWFADFVNKGVREMRELNRVYRKLPASTLARSKAETKAHKRQLEYFEQQTAQDDKVLAQWKAILHDEQLPQWRRFVRWLNRSWWMERAYDYGEERIDLVKLMEEVDVSVEQSSDPKALAANIDLYTQRLDALLLRRAEVMIDNARAFWRDEQQRLETDGAKVWIGPSKESLEQWKAKIRARMTRERATHREIRDLNRDYSRIIADLLPDDAAIEYLDAYQREAIADWADSNSLHGRLYMWRVLNDAELSEDQQQAIRELEESYQSRFGAATQCIVDARDRIADTQFGDDNAALRNKRFEEARDAWYDLDEELATRLHNLLNSEQKKRFPKPRPIKRPWLDSPDS